MHTYFNIVLVLFRTLTVIWFFYSLPGMVAMFMMMGNPNVGSSGPFGLQSGWMLLGMLLPIILFLVAPLLAALCTMGLRRA